MKIKFLISIVALSTCAAIFPMQLNDETTPLHDAVLNNRPDIIKQLIYSGSDINSKNTENDTPLHLAVNQNNFEIAKLLIDNGANIKAANMFDYTPLYFAIFKKNPEIVKLLIDNGANIEAEMHDKKTPLFAAINNLEIAKLLIDKGANIKAKDKYGQTPLTIALNPRFLYNPEIIKLLIFAGADLNSISTDDIHKLIEIKNQNPEIDHALKFISNLSNPDSIKKLFSAKTLKDSTLKKIYSDYLNGDTIALEELLTEKGTPTSLKGYFKPDFVSNVIKKKQQRLIN